MVFVIRWKPGGYVTRRSPDHKPYAATAYDPDTKVWKTYKAAKRFLSLKDELWASHCVIESRVTPV